MKLIVIGHGMVGHKFLECIAAEAGATGAPQVTVLGEEPRPAYDRVHLSEFFAGKSADDLSLVEPGFFPARRQAERPAATVSPPKATVVAAANAITAAAWPPRTE